MQHAHGYWEMGTSLFLGAYSRTGPGHGYEQARHEHKKLALNGTPEWAIDHAVDHQNTRKAGKNHPRHLRRRTECRSK